MINSIKRLLLFIAVTTVMVGAKAPLVKHSRQHNTALQEAIERLASNQSCSNDARSIASSFASADVISALYNSIKNDSSFAHGERARKLAFETLLQVSDYNELGIRVYIDPRQVQLFVQALYDQEPGVVDSILRIAHLIDKRYLEKIVPAVESLFETQSFSLLRNVIQTLGEIGPPAKSSLPELRDYIANPLATSLSKKHPILWKKITENPLSGVPEGWREEMLKQAPQAFVQNEVWVRSAASLARLRIDISLLPSEIALYRTLDPLGQRAGALAILGTAIDTKGVFDGLDATSIAAAEYLSDYGSREQSQKSLTEIIGVFRVVLHSNQTSPGVRRAWESSLENLVTSSNNPEFTRKAARLLD